MDDMRQGIERLKKRVEEVERFDPVASALDPAAATSPLEAAIKDSLGRTFGVGTVEYKLYVNSAHFSWPMNYAYHVPLEQIVRGLSSSKDRSLGLLRQALASLRERLSEAAVPVLGSMVASTPSVDTSNREVFVVHGRDTAARESVARFLERANFNVVILSEQTNRGRTLIEKFEEHSEVGFVVVLLTPDDVGGPQSGAMQGRARQNVILELGYFIAKLGRKRLCVLKGGDVEIPSDVHGVGYTEMDAGGAWQIKLANELRDAGYEIDLNKAIKL